MSEKINLDKDILYDLYINQKLSQKAISKILKCSKRVISRNLNIYGIDKRSYFSTRMTERIMFSDTVLNVLDGALLGDGHLALTKGNNNSQFKYNSSKFDHVAYVASFLKGYLTPETENIKEHLIVELYSK